MARKKQYRFGSHGIKEKKSWFRRFLMGVLSIGKWFVGIKNNWLVALLNLGLLIVLAVLIGEVITLISDKVLKSDVLLGLLQGILKMLVDSVILAALGGITLYGLFRNREEEGLKKFIGLGSSFALIFLLAFNGAAAGVYSKLSNPCYGITPVEKGKVGVLFATFALKDTDKNEMNSWPDILTGEMIKAIKDQGVTLIELPAKVKVDSEEQAQVQNRCYNASLMLWGTKGSNFINIHYTAKPNLDFGIPQLSHIRGTSDKNPEKGIVEGVVDMPSFEMYLENGGDTEYVISVLTGNLQSYKGNFEEATTLYTHAISIAPMDRAQQLRVSAVYDLRGSSYADTNQVDKAIADYNEAIRLDPKNASAFNNRCGEYADLHQYDKAIADCSEAIRLDPTLSLAYYNLGNVFYGLTQFHAAIAQYSKAIELDPTHASPYYNNRGTVYQDLHQYDKAIADYTEAIRIDPNDAPAHYNLGTVFYDLNQYDKAIVAFTEAIRLYPMYTSAYYNRGISYRYENKYTEALADFETYVKLTNNSDPQVSQWIVELKAKLGK